MEELNKLLAKHVDEGRFPGFNGKSILEIKHIMARLDIIILRTKLQF